MVEHTALFDDTHTHTLSAWPALDEPGKWRLLCEVLNSLVLSKLCMYANRSSQVTIKYSKVSYK